MLIAAIFRFDLIIMFFHYLWVGPVQTVVVTLLMYQEVSHRPR